MEPPRVILFDIDGTILDANLSIRETMNRVLLEKGQPAFTKAEVEGLIGNPLRFILSQKCKDAATVEAMVHRYRSAYGESGWVLARLFPGVKDLLGRLHAKGVRLGIVTSKGQGEAETLLFDLGVLDHFDVVVGDDDKRPLKPDPAPVRFACEALGITVQDAIMVGDTRFDITSGQAAGARTIGVVWGNGSREELRTVGADALAGDVRELGRLLGA